MDQGKPGSGLNGHSNFTRNSEKSKLIAPGWEEKEGGKRGKKGHERRAGGTWRKRLEGREVSSRAVKPSSKNSLNRPKEKKGGGKKKREVAKQRVTGQGNKGRPEAWFKGNKEERKTIQERDGTIGKKEIFRAS